MFIWEDFEQMFFNKKPYHPKILVVDDISDYVEMIHKRHFLVWLVRIAISKRRIPTDIEYFIEISK